MAQIMMSLGMMLLFFAYLSHTVMAQGSKSPQCIVYSSTLPCSQAAGMGYGAWNVGPGTLGRGCIINFSIGKMVFTAIEISTTVRGSDTPNDYKQLTQLIDSAQCIVVYVCACVRACVRACMCVCVKYIKMTYCTVVCTVHCQLSEDTVHEVCLCDTFQLLQQTLRWRSEFIHI